MRRKIHDEYAMNVDYMFSSLSARGNYLAGMHLRRVLASIIERALFRSENNRKKITLLIAQGGFNGSQPDSAEETCSKL